MGWIKKLGKRIGRRKDGTKRSVLGKLWRGAAVGIGAAGVAVGAVVAAPAVAAAGGAALAGLKGSALAKAAGGAAKRLTGGAAKNQISQALGGAQNRLDDAANDSYNQFSATSGGGGTSGGVSTPWGSIEFGDNSGTSSGGQSSETAGKTSPVVALGIVGLLLKFLGIFK